MISGEVGAVDAFPDLVKPGRVYYKADRWNIVVLAEQVKKFVCAFADRSPPF